MKNEIPKLINIIINLWIMLLSISAIVFVILSIAINDIESFFNDSIIFQNCAYFIILISALISPISFYYYNVRPICQKFVIKNKQFIDETLKKIV